MTSHEGHPAWHREVSRREFLGRVVRGAAAIPAIGLLSACAQALPTGGGDIPLAKPDAPVTWPVHPRNEPIASDLPIERGSVLQVFNWDQYVAPQVLHSFEDRYDVKIEVTTYYNMTQAVSKIRAGAVSPDIFFPTLDFLGRLIVTDLVQPLNHDYLPNLGNLWPSFRKPFYDTGMTFSIPYAVYTTGIGWRNDLVRDDIPSMANPYDIFWDNRFTGRVYILDDYREAITMAILHTGSLDINTGDEARIDQAREDLVKLIEDVNVKWSLTDYTLLPEGAAWIHQAWSGDMVTAPYYGKGKPSEVAPSLSYFSPSDGHGVVGSDVVVIPRSAQNPVLAHAFLNHLLDEEVAVSNFDWLGYQQPVDSVTVEHVVDTYPWMGEPNWTDALVRRDTMEDNLRQLELAPDVDFLWQLAWTSFRAGG